MALRQSPECRGKQLPQSLEAKISQIANDTALIYSDINALKERMNVIKNFIENQSNVDWFSQK